ncbi:hypothetical protein B0O80DRAFT_500091 [Mortierella sp. GBAus27b]|nr:hypothetical protein BGX31_004307 [Mortierella sp. GBA43]KAI8351728.1 hypothetical protein B0O80DRAFT_500085 [Mortierella sp. GBAus27b]KAI8351736.1 hypothetical protein B0O80DRAFT_500091 [Mortierella sp. GBAus27b]
MSAINATVRSLRAPLQAASMASRKYSSIPTKPTTTKIKTKADSAKASNSRDAGKVTPDEPVGLGFRLTKGQKVVLGLALVVAGAGEMTMYYKMFKGEKEEGPGTSTA